MREDAWMMESFEFSAGRRVLSRVPQLNGRSVQAVAEQRRHRKTSHCVPANEEQAGHTSWTKARAPPGG